MKKYLIILSLLLPSLILAQETPNTFALARFNSGLDYYQEGNLDSTLKIWTEIVDKKIGIESDVYGNAFFNIPTIYWELEEYENAKIWYRRILESDLKDSDETGSLMEPHTNYKHKSAAALAGLYENEVNYKMVIYWLELAETKYPYWGFEGSNTSVTKRKEYLLNWKVGVLLEMDSTQHAIRAILTELICCRNTVNPLDESEQILLSIIKDEHFKSKFDAAIDDLVITAIDSNNWHATFKFQELTYTIPISDTYPSKELPHYWSIIFIEKGSEPDKEEIIKTIRSRSFYMNLKG